ncbi:MAG: tRNA pseudouridine(13) synthase TruD [Candidatus Bathyarchaeia archaeon]
MEPPELDKSVGMEVYGTRNPGIGGVVKARPCDFIVKEVVKWFGAAPLTVNRNYATPNIGSHLVLALVKEGWDTLYLLREVKRKLFLRESDLYTLGFKDARALTAQFLWMKRFKLRRFSRVRLPEVRIYPLAFTSLKLNSTHLLGNLFEITVRNLACPPFRSSMLVKQTLQEATVRGGFPNFYGYQRFGTRRPVTHMVGKHIVLRNFEAAVTEYLTTPSRFEKNGLHNVRELILKGDFHSSYKKMPKKYFYERLLLKAIKDRRADYVNALRKLPMQLRKMFVYAYQAYLFNKTLSLRLKVGLSMGRAEPGDLVLIKIPYVGEECVKVDQQNNSKVNELIAAGKATLAIPLFGYMTVFSSGKQGLIEKKILEEEGLTPRFFYIGPMPEVSCPGGLRPASIKLRGFQYHIHSHDRKITFKFYLGKLEYATTVLREFMKPKHPVEAGF